MVEPLHQADAELKHPDVQYERTDVNFRVLMIIGGSTIVLMFLIHLVIITIFRTFNAHADEAGKSPYPLAATPGAESKLPSGQPRLEQIQRMTPSEAEEYYQRELADLEKLKSYDRTDEKGYVQIPIDQAMKVLLEKKVLKSRSEPPADERRRAGGLLDAGGPNSGRVFTEDAK